MKVAILGLGRMGSAIAERLLDTGHSLVVWNRSAGKAQALLDRGAIWAATPQEAVSKVDLALSMLTDAAAIENTYSGVNGALTGDVKGKLFVDMSTVRPETSIHLNSKVVAVGAALLECPVGGTVGPAKQGQLFGFVGGEAADFSACQAFIGTTLSPRGTCGCHWCRGQHEVSREFTVVGLLAGIGRSHFDGQTSRTFS